MENAPAQGSNEWMMQRCGRITASNFGCIVAKPKGGEDWTKAAQTLAHKIAAERITGRPADSGGSAATDWGQRTEDPARAAYEFDREVTVEEAGFIAKGDHAGGSPDGYTIDRNERGLHEIKCPFSDYIHLQTLIGGMPSEHTAQVQGNLWVTGLGWNDFVSFNPNFDERRRLFVQRVSRDEDYINHLAERVAEFDRYVQQLVERSLR